MTKKNPLLKPIIVLSSFIILIIMIISKSRGYTTINEQLINNSKILTEKLKNIEEMEKQIQPLKIEIENGRKQITDLKSSIETLKLDSEKLKKTNAELSSKLKEIEEKSSAEEGEKIKILKEKKQQLENNITKADLEEKELQKEIKKYEDKLAEIEKEKHKRTSSKADTVIMRDEMVTFIQSNFKGTISFELLYRFTRDGKEPKNFHDKIDKYSNIIVVAKTNDGIIFGGYTSQNFEGKGFKVDRDCFLFNLNKKIRFPVVYTAEAIYADPNSFPVFGNGDLNLSQGTSNFPKSFSGGYYELTNGNKNFKLEELEIFRIYNK